jgi:hypothetical protein
MTVTITVKIEKKGQTLRTEPSSFINMRARNERGEFILL